MTRTQEYIRKFARGQVDDYTTGCLLDYPYFENHYKMIAIDLSKKQALDADPKAIQQINLQQIQTGMEIQQCFLLLTKQKKLFWNFNKEVQKFCECNFFEYNFVKHKIQFNFYCIK